MARRRRARRPRSLRSTRPSSAAAASRAARSIASSSSGPATADSWPMSRRIVISVLEAIKGSVTPSTQTRVRRPSPRCSPVIRSKAKIRSARANLPKPNATMRESDATWPSCQVPRPRTGEAIVAGVVPLSSRACTAHVSAPADETPEQSREERSRRRSSARRDTRQPTADGSGAASPRCTARPCCPEGWDRGSAMRRSAPQL